jgi:hypothetical protein
MTHIVWRRVIDLALLVLAAVLGIGMLNVSLQAFSAGNSVMGGTFMAGVFLVLGLVHIGIVDYIDDVRASRNELAHQ